VFSNILFLFTPIYLGKVIQFDLHIIFKRVETQPPTNVNYPAERELRYVRGKVTSYAEDVERRVEDWSLMSGLKQGSLVVLGMKYYPDLPSDVGIVSFFMK